MAGMNTVADGQVKYREGKKWKSRWCTVRMPSPVADRLQVFMYKDCKDAIKNGHAKTVFPLEGFYGIESGFSYEKEAHVMAVICQKQVILMAFETREPMIHFELKIRRSLGEEHQFPVRLLKVPSHSKLSLDVVRMHVHNAKFCFTAYVPPKLLMSWQVTDLRRFGPVDGKFVFEGGSRCGRGTGVHVLATDQAEDVAEIIQMASQGKSGGRKYYVNRRSQLSEHLESFKPFYLDGMQRDFSRSPLHSLDLDQKQDESEWQKRHSISATDYGWAQGYSEKHKLISIENLEGVNRNQLIAIYDIPPRRVKKVERCNEKLALSAEARIPWLDKSPSTDTAVKRRSLPQAKDCIQHLAADLLPKSTENLKSIPQNSGVILPGSLGDSASYKIDVEIDRVANNTRRQEAWDKLKKEEQSLHHEMSLLDEILQVYQLEETKPSSRESRSKFIVSIRAQSVSSCMQSSNTEDTNADGNRPREIQFRSNSCSLSNVSSSKRNSSGYWDNKMLSPNFLSKLKKIPSNSKLAAPLPYVNLEKYDAGDDGEIHISLSSTGSTEMLPTTSKVGNYDNLNPHFVDVTSTKRAMCSLQKFDYKTEDKKLEKEQPSSDITAKSESGEKLPSQNSNGNVEWVDSPPELPPKGPNKNRNKHFSPSRMAITSMAESSKQAFSGGDLQSGSEAYQIPQAGEPVIRVKDHDINPNDSYFLMGRFSKETAGKCQSTAVETENGQKLKVGLKSLINTSRGNAYVMSGYMDMTGKFETPVGSPAIVESPSCASIEEDTLETELQSDNSMTCQNNGLINVDHSEENYMEMSGMYGPKRSVLENLHTLQTYVSTTAARDGDALCKQSAVDSSILHKLAVPFPNLKNFQKLVTGKSKAPALTASTVVSPSEKPVQENSGKSPGFFSRLMRRNSKDHRSSSQSQENLSVSSGSLEKSSSARDSISSVDNIENVTNLPVIQIQPSSGSIERQRSSSFPSESCYHSMVPENQKVKCPGQTETQRLSVCQTETAVTNQKSCNDNLLQVPFKELAFDQEVNGDRRSKSFTESYIYMGPLINKNDKHKNKITDSPSKRLLGNQPMENTVTVLHVQEESRLRSSDEESSKTDDEKLLELYQSGKSQNTGDTNYLAMSGMKQKLSLPLSPEDEAAAIARHVSALPPFIPPKTKNYPCSLSPVLETSVLLPNDRSEISGKETRWQQSSCAHQDFDGDFQLNDLSDYVQQKQQVHTTLKIMPASEEDDGRIWIPRDESSRGGGGSLKDDPSHSLAATDSKIKADASQPIDNTSTRGVDVGEDSVRSSPASTILRPRSGKEYQLVERKKPGDEYILASSPRTPQSPSGGTVFTFDSVRSPTSYGKQTTSSIAPPPQRPPRQNDPSYVNLIKDGDILNSLYVNLDMNPSCSPYGRRVGECTEQNDLQLNYAEIDLSPKVGDGSSAKMLPKTTAIDYATIDLIATVAAQKASREHAQSRGDNFQQFGRKYSSPTLSSGKERKSNGGHVKDKKHSSNLSD